MKRILTLVAFTVVIALNANAKEASQGALATVDFNRVYNAVGNQNIMILKG